MVIHISLRCVEPPRTLLDDCSVHQYFAEGIYPLSVIGVDLHAATGLPLDAALSSECYTACLPTRQLYGFPFSAASIPACHTHQTRESVVPRCS